VLHNFKESLAASHRAEDLPIWLDVYRKAFPTMRAMINHREDGDHQRNGIDRSIILENSKQLLIDEKVRFKSYPDIALEFLSAKETSTPGWVCKPLLADYIAYAVAPIGKCYLLPVPQLQEAWRRYGEEWKAQHFIAKAINISGARRWTTLSCCVPVSKIFPAIGECLRVDFTPFGKEVS